MTVLLQSMDMVETSPEIPFPITMSNGRGFSEP